jgi:hypothetical protein
MSEVLEERLCKYCDRVIVIDRENRERFREVEVLRYGQSLVSERLEDSTVEIMHLLMSARRTAFVLRQRRHGQIQIPMEKPE